MNRNKIASLLASINPIDFVCISGWVRTRRDAKTFSFMEINDGSCRSNIQVIADDTLKNYEAVKKLSTGSAVTVFGVLRESPGKGQRWEIEASAIEIHGLAPDSFPLQKKRHSDEFLREICHLRPRTNKYGAVFRIRSALSSAVHQFFKDHGFFYIHTPILTGSDCEGAGQLFRVTSMDMENLPKISGETDYQFDFFKKPAFLTVSGQLEAEMLALALGDVYTFGPTFRAENSNTSRHMAEFWMVEPEMAFCDLDQNMAHAESFIRYLVNRALTHCADDLELFSAYVDKTLLTTLNKIASSNFIRLTYTEAIDILKNSNKIFQYDIDWGSDLQTEHERYLCEDHFNGPLIIYNYPASIKPFYMRVNDDEKTVGAMDVIVPRIGEIIGGSRREDRFDVLSERMAEAGLKQDDYWWYLESRRYGSVPHSGYGLGFDRLIMLITGITNIRDVIPFPRTPGNIEF
ncbi:MAG: asparagine--tRNA ligase [Desulfobacteraceae bacterium]|jgi:asparaginyl-tRNA synthetase|nr:MAG: asparagine--tRNA ligase [Desulfobacteraceae bacterium]